MSNIILPKEFASPGIIRPTDDSLVLWFNGRMSRRRGSLLADLSKKGNNGIIYGACWKNTPLGYSVLEFDGVDDYINCGNDESLQVFANNNQWTLEWWAYMEGTGDSPQDFFNGLSHNPRVSADMSDRNLCLCKMDPTYTTIVCTDIGMYNLKEWTHFVIQADTDKYRIFINGVEVKNTDYVQMNDKFSSFYIGRPSWNNESFHGLIGEVRIYNRALTASEIQQRYQNTKHLYGY